MDSLIRVKYVKYLSEISWFLWNGHFAFLKISKVVGTELHESIMHGIVS